MKPLYKVGDKVLIKTQYDPGCDGSDYRFWFTNEMLAEYGGQICEIKEVSKSITMNSYPVPDDYTKYHICEDDNFYCWASSIFESEF